MRNGAVLVLAICCVALLPVARAAFAINDTLCVGAGVNTRDRACGAVKWNSNGNERGRLVSINSTVHACSLGQFTWLEISMQDHGPTIWVAQETNLVHECGPKGAVKVFPGVPYINQRYDTGDHFDGSWACGPTTALMALAGMKKLQPHSIDSSQPWAHPNSYGWYDSNVYTSPTGFQFTRTQNDPKGRPFAGAWGSCTNEGGAWADLTQKYIVNHGGITAEFHDAPTSYDLIKKSIDAGKMVVQSTQIRGAGHLVLVHGYMPDGRVVVNDPWGDANGPNWGKYPNGEKVLYTMALLAPKWCIVVGPHAVANETYVPVSMAPPHVWTDTRRPLE